MSEEDYIYENNSNASIWPHAIRNGVIWGLIGSVILLVSYFTGALEQALSGSLISSLVSGFVSLVVAILLVYSAIKGYREDKGSLTFGNAVGVGALTGLVYGIVAAVWAFIFYSFIFPEFFDIAMEGQAAALEDAGLDDDQIEQQLDIMKMFSNPIVTAISAIPGGAISGTILSLIIGIFTKTD